MCRPFKRLRTLRPSAASTRNSFKSRQPQQRAPNIACGSIKASRFVRSAPLARKESSTPDRDEGSELRVPWLDVDLGALKVTTVIDVHRFQLRELLHRASACFAMSVTRSLDASKRQLNLRSDGGSVDIN
jgi:hypothetical protein